VDAILLGIIRAYPEPFALGRYVFRVHENNFARLLLPIVLKIASFRTSPQIVASDRN
jgi:hypothetical protein